MYNYFMICGNVKSIEKNVVTVTSSRAFKNADGRSLFFMANITFFTVFCYI